MTDVLLYNVLELWSRCRTRGEFRESNQNNSRWTYADIETNYMARNGSKIYLRNNQKYVRTLHLYEANIAAVRIHYEISKSCSQNSLLVPRVWLNCEAGCVHR